jgi:hypothetical protein
MESERNHVNFIEEPKGKFSVVSVLVEANEKALGSPSKILGAVQDHYALKTHSKVCGREEYWGDGGRWRAPERKRRDTE